MASSECDDVLGSSSNCGGPTTRSQTVAKRRHESQQGPSESEDSNTTDDGVVESDESSPSNRGRPTTRSQTAEQKYAEDTDIVVVVETQTQKRRRSKGSGSEEAEPKRSKAKQLSRNTLPQPSTLSSTNQPQAANSENSSSDSEIPLGRKKMIIRSSSSEEDNGTTQSSEDEVLTLRTRQKVTRTLPQPSTSTNQPQAVNLENSSSDSEIDGRKKMIIRSSSSEEDNGATRSSEDEVLKLRTRRKRTCSCPQKYSAFNWMRDFVHRNGDISCSSKFIGKASELKVQVNHIFVHYSYRVLYQLRLKLFLIFEIFSQLMP